jgi:HK97 family phage major capsid protein
MSRACHKQKDDRAVGLPAGWGGSLNITDDAEAYFSERLAVAIVDASVMMRHCSVRPTRRGGSLAVMSIDDLTNVGGQTDVNSARKDAMDPTIAVASMGSFTFSSGILRVPFELIEDLSAPFISALAILLGQRAGRGLNGAATSGDGSGHPTGIVTAAAVGTTSLSSSGICPDDVRALFRAVSGVYRDAPGAAFMAHSNVIDSLRDELVADGTALLREATELGGVPSIFGKPVFSNDDMVGTVTAGSKPLIFGDLKKFIIRQAREITVRQFFERYIEYDERGFDATGRFDSQLLDGGGGAVKSLQMASA